jgi:cysteine desulfurase
MSIARTIYLDNAATTEVLPEVVQAMTMVMTTDFGNPSSRHAMGAAAEGYLNQARQVVARRLGCPPAQLIFTSGGTEANALALLGVARAKRPGRHVLCSAIEHASVLDSARLLSDEGADVEQLPVTAQGEVDPAMVASRLRPETVLVAVMHINNETGIVQPVEEIGRVIQAHNLQHGTRCRFLVDAVQSFTVMPVGLAQLGADLVTVSAHKIHGPKGVGALAVADNLRLAPLWGGGDQEAHQRPGTENLPGIVGFARAVELSPSSAEHWPAWGTSFLPDLLARWPRLQLIGEPARRAPHILALAVAGLRSEVLVNALEEQGVFASSGSACHSRRSLRSHVLEAMGLPYDSGVLRLSMSSTTSEADLREVGVRLERVLSQLKPRRR